MECTARIEGDFSIVSLAGEIDLYCSADARKEILQQLSEEKSVIVDLSQVKYIDSSAIASLVEGLQMAKKSNLNFSLVAVSEPAMQVIKLARLDKVFSIYSTVEDAANH